MKPLKTLKRLCLYEKACLYLRSEQGKSYLNPNHKISKYYTTAYSAKGWGNKLAAVATTFPVLETCVGKAGPDLPPITPDAEEPKKIQSL